LLLIVTSSKEVLAWITAQRLVTSISSVIIPLLLMFLIGIPLYLSILENHLCHYDLSHCGAHDIRATLDQIFETDD